ncbi:MAG: hypothetical protein IJB86_04180 [Clostridia bacterium]|nr:hypothetical protein [Clostridia bacterium]
MKVNSPDSYDFDIIQIAKLLLRKAWMIALCAVLAVVIGISCAFFFVTPKYSSSVMLYVNNRSTSASVEKIAAGLSSSDLSVAQSLVDTYIVILRTRTTLNEVIKKAGVDLSYEQVNEMISAESVNSTEVFSITVTSENPETAQLLAKTIGEVLPAKISSIVVGTSAKLVDNAIVNKKQVSPNYIICFIICFMAGAVLGCAIVIIRDITDDVIHSEDYLLQTFDAPVLAVIPNLSAESASSYMRRYATNSDDGKENV